MRLIDADAFKKYMRNNIDIVVDSEEYCGLAVVDNYIDAYGVVNAVPVVHGRWEDSTEHRGYQVCNACHGCYVDHSWVGGGKWTYCPNCGAKMDGGNT